MTLTEMRALFRRGSIGGLPLSEQLEIGRRREQALHQLLSSNGVGRQRREKLQRALDAQQRINRSQTLRLSLGHEW